jgi:membrane carboxypeptidase/penicillin-binding protein
MGYPSGEIPMESVHGIAVTGGSFPAQIWQRFMQPALEPTPELDFPEPSHYPEYRYFQKGDWGYYGSLPYAPDSSGH